MERMLVCGGLTVGMVDAHLQGRTALISGASSGIGAATARVLAADGADVVLAARRESRLQALATDLEDTHDVETLVVPTDVRESGQVATLVDRAVERFDGLDIVVVNAGLARGGDIAEMTDEEYDAMQRTNTDGAFYLAREALSHVTEAAGHLVFVGSFAGEYPRPYNPVYAATKWWLRGFAKSLSAQIGDSGAGVSIVNPAAVRTEFDIDGVPMADRYEAGEVVAPEEVAEAIAFIARQAPSMAHEISLYERDKLTTLGN